VAPVAATEPGESIAAQSPPLAEDEPAGVIVTEIKATEEIRRSDDPGAPADSTAMPLAEDGAQPVQAALQPESEMAPVAAQSVPAEPEMLAAESASLQTPESSEVSLQLATLDAQIDGAVAAAAASPEYRQWLAEKLALSLQWLGSPDRRELSIQVMMRKKSAARELVYYLRNEWPLDISQTYIYEVEIEGRPIYRVFYSEFDSLQQARAQIDLLPDSVKINAPYVHSVNRMRQALL